MKEITCVERYRRAVKKFAALPPFRCTTFSERQNSGGMKTVGSSMPTTMSKKLRREMGVKSWVCYKYISARVFIDIINTIYLT